ncbi:MAG: hypothetical protein KUL77_01150 [Thermomonas sp.]|jgi:hypothetical protein|uniref:hypothetical protein n=1 Tax=Thermomonas sp. TaxID=1971895 RepID=UPI001EC98302|nr:hypothetical protein [Thermomonas sp.]MBV2208157.1 hypothetical protein [Thermomonas sp.]
MEFRIKLATDTPDMAVVTDALQDADPAAFVDLDQHDGSLRATVWMSALELTGVLTAAGYPPKDVEQLASNCCGECSG